MFLEVKKAEHAYVVTTLCSVYRDPTPDRKQTRVLLLLLLLLLRWMAREVLTQITFENGRLREDLKWLVLIVTTFTTPVISFVADAAAVFAIP